jgi:hypothetical protein
MITLWTIAGGLMGWMAPEFLALRASRRVPLLFNIASTFIGALAAYTYMVGLK